MKHFRIASIGQYGSVDGVLLVICKKSGFTLPENKCNYLHHF